MAIIKLYTDEQQSKKLASILPLKSADAHWYNNTLGIGYDQEVKDFCDISNVTYIAAWSLSALLSVLPNENMLVKTTDCEYYCLAKDVMTKHYDNPVDACYELILKLHELNLL